MTLRGLPRRMTRLEANVATDIPYVEIYADA